MRRSALVPCLLLFAIPLFLGAGVALDEPAADCGGIIAAQKMPLKLKLYKNPTRARWDQFEKPLIAVREAAKGKACGLKFGELFAIDKPDVLFPVTHVVLSTVPESTFQGLKVYDAAGQEMGEFDSRVPHERSGGMLAKQKTLIFSFQYKDKDGLINSVSPRLPDEAFLVRWDDIKDRVAVSGAQAPTAPGQSQ